MYRSLFCVCGFSLRTLKARVSAKQIDTLAEYSERKKLYAVGLYLFWVVSNAGHWHPLVSYGLFWSSSLAQVMHLQRPSLAFMLQCVQHSLVSKLLQPMHSLLMHNIRQRLFEPCNTCGLNLHYMLCACSRGVLRHMFYQRQLRILLYSVLSLCAQCTRSTALYPDNLHACQM